MVVTNLLLLQIAKFTRPLFIGLILCVSHSRTFSIVNGYGAPLEIYKHFEHHDDAGTGKNSISLISIEFLVLQACNPEVPINKLMIHIL